MRRLTFATVVALGAVTLFAGWEDEAWRFARTTVYCPKTKLVYDYRVGTGENALVGCLPTPKEIRANFPVVTGWSTGMEDSVLSGTTLLLAAMARYDRLGEPETLDFLHDLFDGLCHCCEYAKVPGFLARSICPADGRSHYINSSRDQYTLFVYTMWRYANSAFCPPARRDEIAKIVADVASFAHAGARPEHGFNLLREDGKPGIVCTTWMPDPWGPLATNASGRVSRGAISAHEVGRLPMIYAAAHAFTGDAAWRARELEIADAALRMEEADELGSYHGFELFQMQVSQRLLWECETNPARRARYLKMLRRVAQASLKGMDRAEKLYAELNGRLSAPAGDWRGWDRELVTGGDGVLNGMPYRKPIRPAEYQKAYDCVREMGEAVIVPLTCPDFRLAEDHLARFRRLAAKADFAHVMSPGLVYPVLAREMTRQTAIRGNVPITAAE